MALIDPEINYIRSEIATKIPVHKKDLRDCWNTFQWVTNRLNDWASETVIGATLRENLVKLNQALELLIKNTDTLSQKIDTFGANQIAINEGHLTK